MASRRRSAAPELSFIITNNYTSRAACQARNAPPTGRTATGLRRCEVFPAPDVVGLSDPAGELGVELVLSGEANDVEVSPGRDRLDSSEAGALEASGQPEADVEPAFSGRGAGEADFDHEADAVVVTEGTSPAGPFRSRLLRLEEGETLLGAQRLEACRRGRRSSCLLVAPRTRRARRPIEERRLPGAGGRRAGGARAHGPPL